MWWLIIVFLLLSRRSGTVSASVNVNPVATPSGTTNVGAPVPFIKNPDIGTFHAISGTDASINLAVGAYPTTFDSPALPPSNSIANLVVMAPPPEPFIQPGFTEIAPGISIPTGSNDGIISTPVTLRTASGVASFTQTQGTTVPRMVQL
jgi:hypothetical protein